MSNSNFFDVPRVTRMISMGYKQDVILPLFLPLIRQVINTSVAYDPRNQDENDLVQIGLLKAVEIINTFRPKQGNLFSYSVKLMKHALWSEVKLRKLDKQRVDDEIDFDTITNNTVDPSLNYEQTELSNQVLKHIRAEHGAEDSAKYVFGVLSANDYVQNRERVLKTLVNGFDVNLKQARYLIDHILVILRIHYSRGVKEVRDDKFFRNKFQYSLVPELRQIVGERAFERIVHYFGGLTLYIPSVDSIAAIDRDLSILKALAHDWTCGPTLSKKYGISPEGIKSIYKNCLHRLHNDKQYRELVSQQIPLDKIPGYEDEQTRAKKPKMISEFGQRKPILKRRPGDSDSMAFKLGCRNSLIFTMIASGQCTRPQIVKTMVEKFGGTEQSAKSTLSAFMSDIKQPFGRYNTSRNLIILTDAKGILSFEAKRLSHSQRVVAERIQTQMVAAA